MSTTTTELRKLTEKEMSERVYLFRVVRAGNDRPGERDKLRWLMQCWDKFHGSSTAKKEPTP